MRRQRSQVKAEHGGARVALASLLLRAKQEPVAAEQLLRDALRSNPRDVAAACTYAGLLESEYQDYDAAQNIYVAALSGGGGGASGEGGAAVAAAGRVALLCRYAGLLAVAQKALLRLC